MAKYLDENGLLYFWQHLKNLFGGKVDKVQGKDLSTNDYTNADMTKLAGIEGGAEVNIIESILVNGSAAPVSSKSVSITVPTKTSDLTNNSGFITINDIPPSGVSSVNTKTGDVVLTYTDVGAAASSHEHTVSDISDFPDITGVYVYKGSVATYSLLPATGMEVGDVWNVEADGMNYAWTGSAWDALGGNFSITSITNGEIDTILAS